MVAEEGGAVVDRLVNMGGHAQARCFVLGREVLLFGRHIRSPEKDR
jgi:hypothetical protein